MPIITHLCFLHRQKEQEFIDTYISMESDWKKVQDDKRAAREKQEAADLLKAEARREVSLSVYMQTSLTLNFIAFHIYRVPAICYCVDETLSTLAKYQLCNSRLP